MSNTKIVIDYEGDTDYIDSVLNGAGIKYTEIQIDQSIEERANEHADNTYQNDLGGYKKGAKDQQIIEQLRVKEKEEIFVGFDEEGNAILSSECKPKEKCGDSDWWIDEQSKVFRSFYTYHDKLNGLQTVHEECIAVKLTK
jgi:hypothetical protein